MLAGEGCRRRVRAASTGCCAEQEPDGSWFGRWGANYVYGTGHVLPALVAAGVPPDHKAIRRAVALARARPERRTAAGARTCAPTTTRPGGTRRVHRVSDGVGAVGPARRGGGRRRAGRPRHRLPRATQREDGGWDEPWYTGTGFPRAFYINYHLYRLIFPVSALGGAYAPRSADAHRGLGRRRETPGPARRPRSRSSSWALAARSTPACARATSSSRRSSGTAARRSPVDASIAEQLQHLSPRLGPVVTVDRIAGPDERAAQQDALAVDLESFWVEPTSVVRVVVDEAGRRLLHPKTLLAGVRALRTLRRVGRAIGSPLAMSIPLRQSTRIAATS